MKRVESICRNGSNIQNNINNQVHSPFKSMLLKFRSTDDDSSDFRLQALPTSTVNDIPQN